MSTFRGLAIFALAVMLFGCTRAPVDEGAVARIHEAEEPSSFDSDRVKAPNGEKAIDIGSQIATLDELGFGMSICPFDPDHKGFIQNLSITPHYEGDLIEVFDNDVDWLQPTSPIVTLTKSIGVKATARLVMEHGNVQYDNFTVTWQVLNNEKWGEKTVTIGKKAMRVLAVTFLNDGDLSPLVDWNVKSGL